MKQEKILELLSKMTIEEKIGQLVQTKGELFLDGERIITGPQDNLKYTDEQLFQVGSILNMAGSKNVRKIQDMYLEKNRLRIPLLFTGDVINGYKTIFPIPLLQGCSWDLDLIYNCACISSKEAGYAGIQANFSPMVDLVRDSRWGRVLETTGGEDVLLSSLYAKKIIDAYHSNNMASCAKHYIAYGAVEGGKEYNFVDMSKRELLEYYLPPFKACIEADVDMIMPAFSTFDDIPCTVNSWLLKEILRKHFNFNGVIISDYSAILETISHGYCSNKRNATLNAIKATVDIDMMTDCYLSNIKALIETNKIAIEELDASVLRILNLKNKLGLFENPYGNANPEKEKTFILSKENLELARKYSSESFVLLENKNNILPLSKNTKIALIGPYADNKGISGAWSIYNQKNEDTTTIKQALLNYLDTKEILYSRGCPVLEKTEIDNILAMEGQPPIPDEQKTILEETKQAIKVAKDADVIILAIGEHYKQSGEGASRSNIEIPKIQQDLLYELSKLNKPIIAIVFSGRPLVLNSIANKVSAMLWVGFPGSEGGNSICDLLYGKVNPCGKLNMSFPQASGQCPIYYNHYSTGRPAILPNYRFTSRYQDIPDTPLYPFGYGLSYSNFEYSNLILNKKVLTINSEDFIEATITVKNNSNVSGYEIIQLYTQDLFGKVIRPVKELKAFKKEFFKAKEEKNITFKINIEMLKFLDQNLNYIAEPGEFKIYIGKNSKENLETTFMILGMEEKIMD